MRFYKKKHEASQGQMADVKTKNIAQFKRGQNRLENKQLALLI